VFVYLIAIGALLKAQKITSICLIAAPLVYIVIAWSFNYFMGFISFSYPRDSLQARYAGAALMMPLITAAAWWGCRFCLLNASINLGKVIGRRRKKSSSQLSRILTEILDHALRRAMPYILILAFCIGAAYLYINGLFVTGPGDTRKIFLMIQVLPLWTAILAMIYCTFIVFRLMSRHIRHHFRIRLFEIERLQPLGNLVVVNFLLSSALLSLYSINILVADMPTSDLLIITGLLGLILSSLLYPMLLLRSVLADRKASTLERINSSLNFQLGNSHVHHKDRRLVDDKERLQHISDLLTVRKEIADEPIWPVNLPFTIKLLGLISLPIVSWTGAGLVSQFLKFVVE
jgi:hypothetical protein